MKLFQSLAVAMAVVTTCGGGSFGSVGGVLAFVLSSPSKQVAPPKYNGVLRMAGIHEPSASLKADENYIKRELLFRQVVKEVNMASEYLDWLVATSSSSSVAVEGGDAATTTTPPIVAAGDDAIELLGGSGGGGVGNIITTDQPPPNINKPSTQYKPTLRANLGSTILLSGSDVLDSTLLSILNKN